MAIELPREIMNYFEADKGLSPETIAACFTADGVVRDEGNIYRGRDAIRRWKEESASKYSYTSEPFAIDDVQGQMVVKSRVAGDFPGSPVDLRYTFVLDGGKIANLEIIA